ncbi:hypothetical protein LAC1533_0342 [Ligilactobacillus acidipiscis]|uniref:Uncharacterized protein n=1 Tax=Ligilactobacillus acidipiscis TaxID=89059 RepID=A0A1K1KLN3_9LACO|nr:hypothetical protein LAC1533_0342 [Ligilactobacillus acidipiscis]
MIRAAFQYAITAAIIKIPTPIDIAMFLLEESVLPADLV